MDAALRGKLERAAPVYADTPDAAFDLFCAQRADVLAGIRPGLLMYADMMPGARVLADRYGQNIIALSVNKGEAAWLSYVSSFAEQARADGTVERAIADAGLRGVQAARVQARA
jgi:polar amino acid transport system substrate-binding protein